MTNRLGFVVCALVLVWGCDSDDVGGREDANGDFGEGAVQARFLEWNDFRLNDFRLNDFRLNASRINDFRLNGDSTSDWIEIYDFWLPDGGSSILGQTQGGMLKIHDGWSWLTEWEVEGTIIEYHVKTVGQSQQTKQVWLKWADEIAPYSDVWTYDADIRTNGGPWEPLCRDAAGNRVDTLVVSGAWNPSNGNKVSSPGSNTITLACRSAAIAKCIEFGYRPWASKNGTSLANYHQACTRMVRADYCGDGVPHTVTGTPIHVLDQIGIQNVAPGASYVIEAEWNASGAVCLNPANTRLDDHVVTCTNGRVIPACGASFASGGIIQSGKLD